ncbi:MAG: Zn-ribbon domain-containing OB-fold protein [Acidobacteriota bacterium]|jgi:uncharacterized protein
MLTPPRIRRETPQRYRLEAGKCKKCGEIYFPPRLICRECQGREFETVTLPGTGKVAAYTVIRTAPTGFGDQAPYAMGVVELENGARVLCQVADCSPEEVKVGLEVHLEFRRIQAEGESGVLAYGYKAVPER